MSSRVGLRFSQSFRQSLFRTRDTIFRRHQPTAANPAVEGAPAQKQSLFQRLWTSEVGVKTVHFWYDPIETASFDTLSYPSAMIHCMGSR